MAKIVLSDLAPKDVTSFALANVNFEVPHETTDPVVLLNAEGHPWLRVERDAVESVEPLFRDNMVPAEDDYLSVHNSVANDPAAVAKAREEELAVEAVTPLAVDLSLDQNKPESIGEGAAKVNVTLAADDTDSTSSKRRSTKKED